MTIEQTTYDCLSELYIHPLPTMAGTPQYIAEYIGRKVQLHDLGKPGIVLGGSIFGFRLGIFDEGKTTAGNKELRHDVILRGFLCTRATFTAIRVGWQQGFGVPVKA